MLVLKLDRSGYFTGTQAPGTNIYMARRAVDDLSLIHISAGIAITTAMLSALTGKKVRKDVAMTGEVTLRGRVLPIGGLKEKTMAALRNGIETVIIPRENEKDLEEIDQTVRRKLRFVPVSRAEEVFSEALVSEGKKTAAQPEEMPLLAVQSCTARPDLRV